VGLGSGLTPSGDDFLGGMFFVFNFLRKNYAASFVFELSRISEFIDRNQEKTNLISLTMLKDLANGQAPAPLYELVNSLMDHQPIESSINSALLITQIGHSTGWDMLTGILVGLLCTRPYSVGRENHS
jgi:AAA+ ATPase superfamily predicted ATPase